MELGQDQLLSIDTISSSDEVMIILKHIQKLKDLTGEFTLTEEQKAILKPNTRKENKQWE